MLGQQPRLVVGARAGLRMGQRRDGQCFVDRRYVEVYPRSRGRAPRRRSVRFGGLDTGEVPETPLFMKSLDLDHATDGEVMIAYGMNGTQLPMLNGFPLRLI